MKPNLSIMKARLCGQSDILHIMKRINIILSFCNCRLTTTVLTKPTYESFFSYKTNLWVILDLWLSNVVLTLYLASSVYHTTHIAWQNLMSFWKVSLGKTLNMLFGVTSNQKERLKHQHILSTWFRKNLHSWECREKLGTRVWFTFFSKIL